VAAVPLVERPTDPAARARIEGICAALPGVSARTSHGELAWFLGAGSRPRQFASTWDRHHDDRNGVVMAAPPGVKGWIGMYLDIPDVDWDLVELRLHEAHAAIGR